MRTTNAASKSASGNRRSTTKKTTASGKKTSAEKNRNSEKRTSAGKSRNSEQKAAAGKRLEATKSIEEINEYQDHLAFRQGMVIVIMLAFAILCYLSFLGLAGGVGIAIGGFLFGMLGWIAWFLPLGCVIAYIFALVNKEDHRVAGKIFSAVSIALILAALTDLFTQAKTLSDYYQTNQALHAGFQSFYLAFRDTLYHGKGSGGILGHFFSNALTMVLGKVGAAALLIALLFLCAYIMCGVELIRRLRKRNAYYQEMEQVYEVVQQEEDYKKPSYQLIPPKNKRTIYSDRTMQTVDLQQMGKQLDLMESEQKKRRETEKKLSQANESLNTIEEIMPDPKMGSKQRKKAEEIRSEQKEAARQAEIDAMESASKEEVVQDLSEIPIYREEMQQKFGGKKAENKKKETISDKHTISNENTASNENVLSQVVLPEQEDAASKPMASFAPKEKDVDIRPASKKEKTTARVQSAKAQTEEKTAREQSEKKAEQKPKRPYQFPPIDLLSIPEQAEGKSSDEELREVAARLQDTLHSFNVNVTMGAVTCGPTVTRYELLPEQGVRVNKITNLADDLKLSLAAESIRIEAPIPGKAAVGIEVPNATPSPVYFRELLDGSAFKKAKSPITFAVGKDIAGKLIMTDIGKMPHLLIAGATGSGKSVCINTLIMSILYKADPSDVKLIMIDPKVVELSVYNGIPHLFCPVVTDPKEAAASLNWAVREMMERYERFKELGVRNIAGYNQKIKTVEKSAEAGYEKMPSLVIIVDEFADLMMVASKEVEDAVCRLAQLARAAGIHLVLATQRPSVNVITGVIKANIPSRIAFSVSSAIDSRTILDKGGAEKLLGKGDMLFYPAGYTEPVRVQGAFVSDKEVSDVVEFLIQENEQPEYNNAVTEITEVPQEQPEEKKEKKSDQDEYFEKAGRFVIESERAAAGQLQRQFSIGFNRAGRIIDQLHRAGVVGPAEGTKPRKILMTMEQFEASLRGDAVTEEDMMSDAAMEMVATEETDPIGED